MNKKSYMRASLEVIAFDEKDIITTSPSAEFGSGGTTILPEDDFIEGIF